MRIYVKKITSLTWGEEEYIVYKEGQYQTPIAILSGVEIADLATSIDEARKVSPPKLMAHLLTTLKDGQR
jgi:hypothetical protein